MTDMVPEESGEASRVDADVRHVKSPWPRVVLALGVAVIVAAAAVAGVVLWPREEGQPVTSGASTTPVSGGSPPSAGGSGSAPSESPVTEVDLSASELAEGFGTAVWRVSSSGCGYEGIGTAFAVGPRTLVTNAHVVANDATPVVQSRDGAVSVSTEVAGADAELDVAVLVVNEDLPGRSLEWAGTDDLGEGQGLVTLGYPVPDHSFTVTPTTVMSFQTEGSTRQALRLDGLVDKGNSGGPALTSTGEVAGVVTELVGEGYQWVGVAYTHDYLDDAIRSIEGDRPGHTVSCDIERPTVPDEWEWGDSPDWDATGPDGYGDDPDLDELYDACEQGDMTACDDLYLQSPINSDYESFGATCGGAEPEPVWGLCSWDEDEWSLDGAGQVDTFGDDPFLDELWTACADGDLVACDDLYLEAPFGSEYESFGGTCGDTGSGYGDCEWLYGDEAETWSDEPMEYGDDSYLDGLWGECEAGDLDSCDTLYYDSPVGSDYEQFGATCGGHLEDPWAGLCYADGGEE